MATYTIDKVIRASIEYELAGGQSAFNVLHLARIAGGPATQVDVDLAATEINNLVTDTFATFQFPNLISDEINIVAAHSRTVDPANPLAEDLVINRAGDETNDPVPNETAYVVTHYTDLASRRGRGRSFVPGVADVYVVAGKASTSLLSAATAVWNGWRTSVNSAGFLEFVVWSPTNATARTVTNSLVRSTFHHQSSRNA